MGQRRARDTAQVSEQRGVAHPLRIRFLQTVGHSETVHPASAAVQPSILPLGGVPPLHIIFQRSNSACRWW